MHPVKSAGIVSSPHDPDKDKWLLKMDGWVFVKEPMSRNEWTLTCFNNDFNTESELVCKFYFDKRAKKSKSKTTTNQNLQPSLYHLIPIVTELELNLDTFFWLQISK